jgi:hypothetical protein
MKKKSTALIVIFMVSFLVTSAFAQSAGDYRSLANGNWSATATWETYNGASWVPAATAPTGTENITVDDSVTVDVAVVVTGSVKVEGSGWLTVGAGSVTFDSGSTYEHARNGGAFPTATWNANSTCLVTGVTGSAPDNSVQNFYNFTWNSTNQSSNLDVSWSGNTIGGNLTVASTGGTNQFRLTSSGDYADTIKINGDVVVTAGVLTATGSSSTMNYDVLVNGSINVTGGSFALSRGSGGTVDWTLLGDLTISNAELRTSNNASKFIFTATDTQQVSFSSVTYTGTINYDVDSSATINIVDGPDTVDVAVNGTVTNINGDILTTGVLSFENNAVYRHARDGGSIPTARWREGSTCEITGMLGQTPSNGNQNFYNFTWNCANQSGNRNLGWNNITIGGDITVINTGGGRWQMTAPPTGESATVTIMGDIIQSGGNFTSNGTSNGNTTIVINHHGNVIVTGGNFSVSRGSQGNGSGTTDWYLYGENFSLTDATTQNSNPGSATFVFAGTTRQNLSLTNVTVTALPVRVAPGAILNLGTSQIGGSGEFRVNAGATLETANAGGLDSAVQSSAVNIFDTTGNYVFNGTVAQITGVSLPASLNKLTIDNAAGVTLSDDVRVDDTLSIVNGDLDLNGNNISLGANGVISETGGKIVGTTGKLSATMNVGTPTNVNVGGLGAVITADKDLGNTMVERYHSAPIRGENQGILRYYNIVPGQNNTGLNATLRFYYEESELNGIAEGNLTMFKSADGSDNSWFYVGGIANTTENYVELTGISDFSYWALGDIASPIPVELTSFTSSTDGRIVTLNWSTATESNNRGWNIERRMKNDKNAFGEWLTVGFVAGAGDNTELASYTYKDKSIPAGIYQYRLKQIDYNGAFSYSDIVEADVTGPVEFALFQNYPNPFNPETVIRFEAPASSFVNLSVYNTIGEKVATIVNEQVEKGVHLWRFDGSNLSSGIYIYRLTTGDKVFIKKMMLIR